MVRRLTTNQEIAGSTPASVIFFFLFLFFLPAFFKFLFLVCPFKITLFHCNKLEFRDHPLTLWHVLFGCKSDLAGTSFIDITPHTVLWSSKHLFSLSQHWVFIYISPSLYYCPLQGFVNV